jgi:hypothetical protein
MKVYYRDRVIEYPDRVPTRDRILKDLELNPFSVLFVDRQTSKLLPPGQRIEPEMEIEVRTVVSGG